MLQWICNMEIRKTCKICNKKIIEIRFRTYCSKQCRIKKETIKYKEYRTNWQRIKRDEEAKTPSPRKIQCLICKKYYIQVCSHVLQVHHLLARDYKKEFGLDVKRGRVPVWYRQLKGNQTIKNNTFLNLENGKRFWFKKGSKIAGRYERSLETLERLKMQFK